MSPRSDGFMIRLHSFLSQSFPHADIFYNAVRNCVSKVLHDERDAKTIVHLLEGMKECGKVEHLSYGFSADNVLTYITWTFKGSKEITNRYGDVAFWDATHNMTTYAYKLSRFTLVDSEAKSRLVLFNLGLSQNAKQCSRLL